MSALLWGPINRGHLALASAVLGVALLTECGPINVYCINFFLLDAFRFFFKAAVNTV